MGVPPIRIEVLTKISGVQFDECYANRIIDTIDGVEVTLLSLPHLKINKHASGRHKDLDDLGSTRLHCNVLPEVLIAHIILSSLYIMNKFVTSFF